MNEKPRLLSTRQAGLFLNVAAQTLANWRFQGVGPNYVKISTRCLYEREELEKFIAANRVKLENES